MNYCELDGDSGSECVDESTHALIRKVRETFDIDNEDVDIPDDDEYMKSFNKFQEEYKNSMKIYLENSQNILRKFFKISSFARDLNINNDYMCFICLERGFDTMIEPCGHVICESCSKGAIQQCPFCRADIRKFKKLIIG